MHLKTCFYIFVHFFIFVGMIGFCFVVRDSKGGYRIAGHLNLDRELFLIYSFYCAWIDWVPKANSSMPKSRCIGIIVAESGEPVQRGSARARARSHFRYPGTYHYHNGRDIPRPRGLLGTRDYEQQHMGDGWGIRRGPWQERHSASRAGA